jgi:hypothetical protein
VHDDVSWVFAKAQAAVLTALGKTQITLGFGERLSAPWTRPRLEPNEKNRKHTNAEDEKPRTNVKLRDRKGQRYPSQEYRYKPRYRSPSAIAGPPIDRITVFIRPNRRILLKQCIAVYG